MISSLMMKRPDVWWESTTPQYGMRRRVEWWIKVKIEEFSRFSLPLIRRAFPNMIAPSITSVQPMTSPVSSLVFLKYIYNPPIDTGYVYAPYISIYKRPDNFQFSSSSGQNHDSERRQRFVEWVRNGAIMLKKPLASLSRIKDNQEEGTVRKAGKWLKSALSKLFRNF